MKIPAVLAAIAALGVAAIGAGPASAADTDPCAGLTATDPAGDAAVDPFPAVTVAQASRADEDFDITGVYFNTRAGKTTAYMQLKKMTLAIPDEAYSGVTSFYIDFATVNDVLAVKAVNDGGTMTYHYDYYDATTGVKTLGDTTGAYREGENGFVAIDLPAELQAPGTKLTAVFGRTTLTGATEENAGYNSADLAPDDGSSSTKAYTVKECPAPEAAAPPAPVETPAGPPAQTPSGTQPAQPNPGAGQPAKPAQPAKGKATRRAACTKKAKKIKNKRKRAKALKRCKKVKG